MAEVIYEGKKNGVLYKVEYEEKPFLCGKKYHLFKSAGGGWSTMYANEFDWRKTQNGKPLINAVECERMFNECDAKLEELFPNLGKVDLLIPPDETNDETKDEKTDDGYITLDKYKASLMFVILSRMLPYKVKCAVHTKNMVSELTGLKDDETAYFEEYDWKEGDGLVELQFVKPYLRPMPDMTDVERKHISKLLLVGKDCVKKFGVSLSDSAYGGNVQYYAMGNVLDYLAERHLDYENYIGRGFALEAPKGMYKNE